MREFVDKPQERPDVEYKSWLDLNDNKTCAKLAKHLCALTNNGGGFLVFGINDDMTSAGICPTETGSYNQDTLSGIIDRYLTPAFQVTVHKVKSAETGITHPVVRVPSHESVPVCSKRDGPHENGKPFGIVGGTYYTRVPGPKSMAVITQELWAPIIHRCVLHDRQNLLADIESLLRSPTRSDTESDELLLRWHETAHQRFLELAVDDPYADQLKRAHYQFSYQLNFTEIQDLDMAVLLEQLRKMNYEVLDLVDSGWSMFWVFDETEFAPRSVTDPNLNNNELLECSLISQEFSELTLPLPDFWRVSPTGLATQIRPYREDRRDFGAGFEAETWLWPFLMAREIAELLRHARALAERFRTVESVSFLAEWNGIKGRVLKDRDEPLIRYRGRPAESDNRVIARTVSVPYLTSRWTDLTAEILSGVMRMFDAGHSIPSERIQSWSKKFRT